MPNTVHIAEDWFRSLGWEPFPFQREAWEACLAGKSGLLNAPTGSGKTYALLLPALLEFTREHPDDYQALSQNGLRLQRR